MGDKSFLSKFVFVLIIIVLIIVGVFFVINNKDVQADMKEVEVITSMNVNTYDEDLYVYKMENNKIYTSEYFYNNYYILNNDVDFNEYIVDSDTKYYLKTLSNSINDLDNVKVTYDPISREQFDFLLDNYSLLKTFIWLDNDDTVRNVLLYSSNNIELVME